MNVGQAMAAALRREGVEFLFCYPTNKLIDECALQGIRPIVVRQERTGIHMADAFSRMSSGDRIGVFAMQHGPGTENSYGAIAQAYGDSVPVVIIAQGYPQRIAGVDPNYSAATSMRNVTKSVEVLTVPAEVPNVMRRAFSQARNGRGGPVVVEVPSDLWASEVPGWREHLPVGRALSGPDPDAVRRAVDQLLAAKQPVLYAGQGVHYARAWSELRELAEYLAIPVATTLPGKSAFPEDHPLSLGSGGLSYPAAVKEFLAATDLILGVGCSFTETLFAVPIPEAPAVIHLTVDPAHLNKDLRADVGMVGDARLGLRGVLDELVARGVPKLPWEPAAERICEVRRRWLHEWAPKLTSDAVPLSPYRVIRDLMATVGDEDVVVTNDAGRPRDQLTPFWVAKNPLSFIGWGKTTQLGYGLGLAMGAKLARPDHLCINVWGDAAVGFTGTDLETAARERIPILSILFNNGGMATEINNIPNAIRLYEAADITGNYCEMAKSLGLYSERITQPDDIRPAIERGVEQTRRGVPVLLEFITAQETAMSRP